MKAYCPSHTGRSEPSFGRRRRDVNSTVEAEGNDTTVQAASDDVKDTNEKSDDKDGEAVYKVSYEEAGVDKYLKDEVETPSHVRKMIEVCIHLTVLFYETGRMIKAINWIQQQTMPYRRLNI